MVLYSSSSIIWSIIQRYIFHVPPRYFYIVLPRFYNVSWFTSKHISNMDNSEYRKILDSRSSSLVSDTDDLLLKTICRYKPRYFGTEETLPLPQHFRKMMLELKGLLRITKSGHIQLTSENVKPVFIAYFEAKTAHSDAIAHGRTLLARACLNELRTSLPLVGLNSIPEIDLLSYAIRYWPYHVRASRKPEDFTEVICWLLWRQSRFAIWRAHFLAHPPSVPDPFRQHDPLPNSLLEVALSFGLSHLTSVCFSRPDLSPQLQVMKLPPDFKFPDPFLLEKFYYCIAQGNDNYAYYDIRRWIPGPPAQPKKYGALSRAILGGNKGIVRKLLSHGVDPTWPAFTDQYVNGDGGQQHEECF
jgi:hypothetical protein